MASRTPKPPTFARWIAAVLKRGLLTWHHLEGWLAFFSYTAVLVILFLPIANWLGLDNTRFAIWEPRIAAAAAGIILVVIILIVTPFRLWRDTESERQNLAYLRDYEEILEKLAELFDEGNNKIFNFKGITADNLDDWHLSWRGWQNRVEEFLQNNLGTTERLMFTNRVLVTKHKLDALNEDHSLWRNILADQLQAIRGIILRHGEQVAKWRAVST